MNDVQAQYLLKKKKKRYSISLAHQFLPQKEGKQPHLTQIEREIR